MKPGEEARIMTHPERRKRRLARLLELAQNYRGWSRRDLARALGRDPTKLIPGSGVPKLDLVVDLAGVLDWNIEDVVEYFWSREEDDLARTPEDRQADFEALDAEARDAHREGEYTIMIKLARTAYGIANSPEQRARACNREAGAWDAMGRYQNAMRAIQRGLRESPVSGDFRRMLQSNLANAYYTIWSLVESRALSSDLLEWFRHHAPQSLRDRKTQAFAHYVAGHTNRRLASTEPDRAEFFARSARHDLALAEQQYLELAQELSDPSLEGIAKTCRGGIIESEAALGLCTPEHALELLHAGLDHPDDAINPPAGDRLEARGWWCIFGCNIVLRHIQEERAVHQHMAIYTNKADEIATKLDNWAIRERVFTMEHTRWERAVGCTGFEIPCVIDPEEVRTITGTMARFPSFRDTGWQILRTARVVGEA